MESIAEEHLKRAGLKTIARNFSVRGGEIDLIMRDSNTLVFIEVRFRKRHSRVSALESVTLKKQRRIIIAAQRFLQQHSELNRLACRFDVVAIESNDIQEQPDAQWIKSAFIAYN